MNRFKMPPIRRLYRNLQVCWFEEPNHINEPTDNRDHYRIIDSMRKAEAEREKDIHDGKYDE